MQAGPDLCLSQSGKDDFTVFRTASLVLEIGKYIFVFPVCGKIKIRPLHRSTAQRLSQKRHMRGFLQTSCYKLSQPVGIIQDANVACPKDRRKGAFG